MTPTQALETLRHALPRSPPPGDAAKALEVLAKHIEAKASEVRFYQEREKAIVHATAPVADGGMYRSDIVSAIERVKSERDDARIRIAELERDRLFVEGERDAARAEVEDLLDHLKAADAAHDEAERDLAACEEAKSALAGELEEVRRSFSEVFRGSQTDRALANKACAERDEVGIQLHAAREEIERYSKGLADLERFMLRQWRPPQEAVLDLVRELRAGGKSVAGDESAAKKGGE